jgi:CSLREA domain-containing protein
MLLITAILLISALPTQQAHAATITVTTFADDLANNGDCSLREAIQAANTDTAVDACPAGSGVDTIKLVVGTYSLNLAGAGEDANLSGDLDILGDVSITGIDLYTTYVDAKNIDRVFHVHSGTTVTFRGISVINGSSTAGGGILNETATLSLDRVTVTNSNSTGNGGGIYNAGGTVTLKSSTIGDNTAQGSGGGIENASGTTIISDNTINNNHAVADGGGIHNTATLTMTNVWTHDNQSDSSGAGIYNAGQATIKESPIHDNYAMLNGGNIYNSNNGGFGLLTVVQTAISHGFADANGGGIYNDGALTVTNTTINTNRAQRGDGIYNAAATFPITLTNTTLVDNTNIPVFPGEGLYNSGSAIVLKNTLIAQNGASGDCAGSITSAGHNLEFGDTCGLNATGDITGSNPLLSPFQDNSGNTWTYALLPGSPALNAGTNVGCPSTDQRGVLRPHGAFCDIGAYETNYAPQAVADGFSTAEDTPLIVTAPGLLANDTDPDNDVITATLITTPAHGALALTPNGALSYIPNANYYGPDSFSYRVGDGSLTSANASVTLTVISVNDPPIAGDDTAMTNMDSVLIVPAALLLGNDSDLEGDLLHVSDVRENSARGGRVALVGNNVVYTPPSHFSGIDSLVYTVSDGNGGTANGTVSVSIGMRLLYMPIARR